MSYCVYCVCVVFTFFMSYVLILARTDPDLYKKICQITTGKVNTMYGWCALFYQSGKSDTQKVMLKLKDCFVRLSWLLHNISRPTTFPTAFVFVTSATRRLKKHEMLGMNRNKGVQEWFTSLVKPFSSAKYPLIYTFIQGISEHLDLNDSNCSKSLQTSWKQWFIQLRKQWRL